MSDLIAMPFTIGIVIILLLFFVVRPFFALLFSKDRLDALDVTEKKQRELEQNNNIEITEEPVTKKKIITDQEKISKLAESNPERAGDLVKEWLKNGE